MRKMPSKTVILALVAFMGLAGAGWAVPPGPPTIASTPTVPVGGPGVTMTTMLVIAGYGIWKARK